MPTTGPEKYIHVYISDIWYCNIQQNHAQIQGMASDFRIICQSELPVELPESIPVNFDLTLVYSMTQIF